MMHLDRVTDESYTAPDLEAQLIAAVEADGDRYWEVVEYLPNNAADAFTVHRAAWTTLAGAIEAGHPAPRVNGHVAAAADPIDVARQLGEAYQRRTLAQIHRDALQRLRAGEPVQDLVARAEQALASVQDEIAVRRPGQLQWANGLVEHVQARAAEAKARLDAGHPTLGFATGIAGLDRILNGLNDANLYLLGGAPGAGKTSLAVQWTCHVAQEAKVPVLFVTFENPARSLVMKAVCRFAGLSPTALERGRADLSKLPEGLEAFQAIAPRVAFLEGTSRTSLGYVEARARQAMSEHGTSRCLIVLDYLQRMAYKETQDDYRSSIAALSLGLRELAMKLNSPILAISSLSRGPDNYDRPTIQGLQGSEDLEFAADVVLLLGIREDTSLASASSLKTMPGARLLDLVIAKNRYGETGKRISLFFRPHIGDFQEDTRA